MDLFKSQGIHFLLSSTPACASLLPSIHLIGCVCFFEMEIWIICNFCVSLFSIYYGQCSLNEPLAANLSVSSMIVTRVPTYTISCSYQASNLVLIQLVYSCIIWLRWKPTLLGSLFIFYNLRTREHRQVLSVLNCWLKCMVLDPVTQAFFPV